VSGLRLLLYPTKEGRKGTDLPVTIYHFPFPLEPGTRDIELVDSHKFQHQWQPFIKQSALPQQWKM
jgi:hypothetical protein